MEIRCLNRPLAGKDTNTLTQQWKKIWLRSVFCVLFYLHKTSNHQKSWKPHCVSKIVGILCLAVWMMLVNNVSLFLQQYCVFTIQVPVVSSLNWVERVMTHQWHVHLLLIRKEWLIWAFISLTSSIAFVWTYTLCHIHWIWCLFQASLTLTVKTFTLLCMLHDVSNTNTLTVMLITGPNKWYCIQNF